MLNDWSESHSSDCVVEQELFERGVTGHEVTASRDGRLAYVPIYGNSGVGQPGTDGTQLAVIDLAARKVTRTANFD